MPRPSVLAAALLAVAGAAASARAEDPAAAAGRAALRKRVEAAVRDGTESVGAGIVAGHPVASEAAVAGIDALPLLDARLRRALDARETQSRTLFAFFRKRLMDGGGAQDHAEYGRLSKENGRLCSDVLDAHDALGRLAAATRARWSETTLDDPALLGAVEAARQALAGTRPASARAAVISGLGGECARLLAPELGVVAATAASRAERLAAVEALGAAATPTEVPALRAAATCDDPHVRRLAWRALAATNVREAVDVLVGRIGVETGVPRDELVAHLVRLTGERFGEAAAAWTSWWAATRDRWSPPPGGDAVAPPPTRGTTRFFGLDIRSDRVVFVIDRSFSMQAGTRHDGFDPRTATAGEPKIAVARRELIQAIRGLSDTASFGVIAYATDAVSLSRRLVPANPANRRHAITWVERLVLEPATNLSGALLEALDATEPAGRAAETEIADTIVVLSDGEPNCGPLAARADLLAEVSRRNPHGLVTIHAVYLGEDGDASLMSRLAAQNGGQFVHFTE